MIDLDTALNIVHCVFLGGLQLASILLYAGGRRYGRRRYQKLNLIEMEAEQVCVGGEVIGTPKLTPSAADSEVTSSDASEVEHESEIECNDETLTCNVCDRSFNSSRLLAAHQHKRRHFGCSVCESIFPSLLSLENHKEEVEHWSEDEGQTHESDSDDETGDEQEETEELERLL